MVSVDLPAPFGPEQADQLPRPDLEVDPRQRLLPPVALAQAGDGEDRRVHQVGRLDLREERRDPLDALAAGAGAELGQLAALFAERREQRLAAARQVGDEQQRRHPQALDQVVEDFVEALGVGLVLGQHPRLRLLDVAVEAADQLPGHLQRLGQLGPVEQLAEARHDAFEVLGEHRVDRGLGHGAVAVALDHRQHPAGEVAVVVGELGLVAGLEAGGGDRAVLAEADLAEEVEAQRVGAEALDHLERVEHVAEALRHLFLAHQQVAVDRHPPRRLEVGGHAAAPARSPRGT